MAPLATILYELGNEVAGSDIDKYIFIEDELRKRNIPIYSFNKDNIKDGYHVIIGNAFDESNEEVKAALENPNVKCTRYYDFLADFMEHYVPDIYKKSIYVIDYNKLKSNGIAKTVRL